MHHGYKNLQHYFNWVKITFHYVVLVMISCFLDVSREGCCWASEM